jgi:hypothetical protein
MTMKLRSALPLVVLAGLAGCSARDFLPDSSPESLLRPTGVGPVAFGNSLAETELLVGEKARNAGGDAGCRYVEFGALPGLKFTVEDGVVTRADAGAGVRNSLGVNLGDLVESVVQLYPDVQTRRSPDTFGGTDLIFPDPTGGHAIVLQAAGNKIISIRAGLNTAVGSERGCP